MDSTLRKRISVGIALLILGGGTLWSAPPFLIDALESVSVMSDHSGGELEVKFVNLRNRAVILMYDGDCCSVVRIWKIGAFQVRQLEIGIDTSSYKGVSLSKTVGLKMKSEGTVEHLRIPFTLRVAGS